MASYSHFRNQSSVASKLRRSNARQSNFGTTGRRGQRKHAQRDTAAPAINTTGAKPRTADGAPTLRAITKAGIAVNAVTTATIPQHTKVQEDSTFLGVGPEFLISSRGLELTRSEKSIPSLYTLSHPQPSCVLVLLPDHAYKKRKA